MSRSLNVYILQILTAFLIFEYFNIDSILTQICLVVFNARNVAGSEILN